MLLNQKKNSKDLFVLTMSAISSQNSKKWYKIVNCRTKFHGVQSGIKILSAHNAEKFLMFHRPLWNELEWHPHQKDKQYEQIRFHSIPLVNI